MELEDFDFAIITFNNEYNQRLRPWVTATGDEMKAAGAWLQQDAQRGILSYGELAVRQAIEMEVVELTVIVISDGGFTEGFRRIRNAIDASQAMRRELCYNDAIIATISIENDTSRYSSIPNENARRQFMREIGVRWLGGHYLVRGNR